MKRAYHALVVLIIFTALAHSAVDDGSILHSGEATFYGDGGGGNCGFPGNEQPLYHGAMNQIDYDSAAACGTWVHIIGPKGEVTAFIDDRCPECREGDIDLGPGTFEAIADKALGRAPIQWRYVEGPVNGPLEYYWQTGSSQWHIAVQIRNHRYAITGVEIRSTTSEWVRLNRSMYNYFVLPGGINNAEQGPYSMRVTDVYGRQLIDSGMSIAAGEKVAGTANFEPVAISVPRFPAPMQKLNGTVQPWAAVCNTINAVRLNRAALFDIYTQSGRRLESERTFLQAERFLKSMSAKGVVIIKQAGWRRERHGNERYR